MIKILQIGMTNNIGGMETYIMSQYRHLDRESIQYDFLNITGESDIVFSSEIKKNGSMIYNISSRHINPLKHYWDTIRLLWNVRHKYRAIVLNTCHLYYIFPLFIAMLFRYPKRIIHSHNSGDELKMTFKRRMLVLLNRMLMKLSVTDYWACSEMAGRWLFKKDEFTVVHNAIEMEKFIYDENKRLSIRSKMNLEDKFVIGNVARFTYQKNHLFLIEVFREIYHRDNTAVLLLIGDSTSDDSIYNTVKNKVVDYGLEKNVRFLGMRQDVNSLYQGMDCFLLPSHFEGLCVAALEAQASGVFCLCSDALSKETKITPNLYFKSLNDSAQEWAEFVIGKRNFKRTNVSGYIKSSGYDINEEVEIVTKLYQE